jgi:threonine-phosphate decarboxylase
MINGHGGNIFDMAAALGCAPMDIRDMSSNVNPLGPPPGLMNHLHDQLDRISALPEAGADHIIRLFSRYHDIDPKSVLAGNGTTQLIHILPQALKTQQALILAPTYSDYADACRMYGVAYRFRIAEEKNNFTHDLSEIDFTGYDTVFICNPNNPTATFISPDNIRFYCRKCPDIRFIIDESYLPFIPDGEKKSLIRSDLPNMIVLNSMSKIFRIPGLRIGFVIADPGIIRNIGTYMLPWSVNTPAQSAVTYLMENKQEISEFILQTREFLEGERKYVCSGLHKFPDLTFFPSMTSFMLAKLNRYTAEYVFNHLIKTRILIRNCTNFQGLSNQFIRISLKTRDVNQLLVDQLHNCYA